MADVSNLPIDEPERPAPDAATSGSPSAGEAGGGAPTDQPEPLEGGAPLSVEGGSAPAAGEPVREAGEDEAAAAPGEPADERAAARGVEEVGGGAGEPGGDDDGGPLSHDVPRHFAAPALISLERLDADDTFRFRPAGELDDVAALATDLARLGQLFPIDVRLVPPDRLQIVTGFRRVAALRFLQREKVLARLHTELSDADALLMALASAIHSRTVGRDALTAVAERLAAEGALTPAAKDMLARALAVDDELAPENVEEEVDADELAADVTVRLSQCNQDLSLLADVFDQLDDEKRDALMTQLRYSIDLVAFLERRK